MDYADVFEVLARVQGVVQFGNAKLVSVDQRGIFGDTPLIVVMSWNDIQAARLLLDAGADVNAKGEDDDTALHRAVSFEDIGLIKLLLERKASRDARNRFGQTPLDLADMDGCAEISTLLRERT